jgi:hypothetical protein
VATRVAGPTVAELGVKVGDIFYASWGYDQTNVDFFEVVGVTAKSVKIVRTAQSVVTGDGTPNEGVVPRKGSFHSHGNGLAGDPNDYGNDPVTKRVQAGYQGRPRITLNTYASAYLWDGTPKYQTGYMFGH